MYIGVLASIATDDLLPDLSRQRVGRCPKGRGGAPLISNLVKEYVARGHRVLAITMDDELADDEPPFVHQEGLLTYIVIPCRKHTFRFNGKRPGRTADFYQFERKQISALLQQYKPDVVHAHWTYEFAVAALAYNPNALITVHDNALTILKYVRTLNRLFLTIMAHYVFRKGRRFTAVSPYMAESIGNWASQRALVVPNPVEIPEQSSVRSLSARPVITTVVNGWDDRKNCINALLAFRRIQQLHPEAVLWGIGTAFVPDGEAAAFCEKYQIENVIFYGTMPHADVLRKIAQSTVLLHTSLEESFGMVLVEAMSYGVPVVAGIYSGAVPWVVQDAGLLVDVTNVDDIVKATHRLLASPELYEQLSEKSIQLVAERFPIQVVADQYLELYQMQNVA
ncbi:glycosyltransferase family 4 protein [Spirosoma fluminis]